MKLFIIHRFEDSNEIREMFKSICGKLSFKIKLIILDSYNDKKWKKKAEKGIRNSELIVIYNPEKCNSSENVKWEIKFANKNDKELFVIDGVNTAQITELIKKIKSIYNFDDEFSQSFELLEEQQVIALYKIMVDSSERLIERRQKTNAFFITVIGSLLAIATLLSETDMLIGKSRVILYGFSVVGLLLCNSWRNLIDNYGKLNKAKFDVILRLEKELGAQIYQAEWIALGKGKRPDKYKSFTNTEKNVPLFFGLLIIVLTVVLTFVEFW